MKDEALNLQKLDDDDPRLIAKIVMKKTKCASQNLHNNMFWFGLIFVSRPFDTF